MWYNQRAFFGVRLRKTVFLFFVFFFLSPPFGEAATGVINFSDSPTNQHTEKRSFFQTFSDFREQKRVHLERTIELRQEEARLFPEGTEVEELSKTLKKLNAEYIDLEKLQAEEEILLGIQQEIERTRFLLEERSRAFHETFELHEQKKRQLKAEILNLEEEIEKLKEIAKNQAIDIAIRFGIFLGFLFFLIALRILTEKMIFRLSGHIPIVRERALIRLNRIVFRVLVALSILVALFSQLISLLPLLAILGTALAFALRDIISSFIAWFIIGTDQGYKIGDLIEAGNIRGRVIEVHPLLTVLRQTGMRGDTGQIISFPNKTIFIEHVRNFSKMYRFIFIMLDFLLEKDSDIDIAKKELLAAMEEENIKDIEEAKKNISNLQANFGIRERNILPKIFIEPDPRGILLRGKYLCRLDNRHTSRAQVTQNFLKRVQKSPHVSLRFVQLGDG
jgi:small-conductance mechanosensitive channel